MGMTVTKIPPVRILEIRDRTEVDELKKKFWDCNCWAQCCVGFGLGVVLAIFASLKLVLILAGVLLIALAVRILML